MMIQIISKMMDKMEIVWYLLPVRSEHSDRSEAGCFCDDKTSPTGSNVQKVSNHCKCWHLGIESSAFKNILEPFRPELSDIIGQLPSFSFTDEETNEEGSPRVGCGLNSPGNDPERTGRQCWSSSTTPSRESACCSPAWNKSNVNERFLRCKNC